MIQVRDSYQVKFGRIDQAVEHFIRFPEGMAGDSRHHHYEVLTDLSGDMFTLVTGLQVESMEEWDRLATSTTQAKAYRDWFRPFQQFVENGARSFNLVAQANAGWSAAGAVVVRTCFRALEWRLAETVDLLKTYGAMLVDAGVGSRPRILTASSGWMFNTIIEIETPDLKVWDTHRKTMFRDPQFQVWFMRLAACASHGSHEFFTVAGQTGAAHA
jgi:hypothetical protein